MELKLPTESLGKYTNNSQIIRVITENWIANTMFCPNCGNTLTDFENNRPVADFFCNNCYEEYELKSKKGNLGKKVVDGAYDTMIKRLKSNNNPNFIFLTYNKHNYTINDLITVPKYFFIEEIIEKRKPLSINARRAGWVGCNISINGIPDFGKVFYIKNGKMLNKKDILEKWDKTTFIKNTSDNEAKGWLLDILICVERVRKKEFVLDDIYKFKEVLKEKHTLNNNIEPKIRQQLQLLRDKNVIEFLGRGKYRLI